MRAIVLASLVGIAACKPPPTDADMQREMPSVAPSFASPGIDSPPSEGALWAESSQPGRIIYGIPGEPIQVALKCANETIEITRFAKADSGAQALLAMVGNGNIGRMKVDAVEQDSGRVWQGSEIASSDVWEALAGPRQLTLTVPGAGMVTLNPSALPSAFVATCRGDPIAEEQSPPAE